VGPAAGGSTQHALARLLETLSSLPAGNSTKVKTPGQHPAASCRPSSQLTPPCFDLVAAGVLPSSPPSPPLVSPPQEREGGDAQQLAMVPRSMSLGGSLMAGMRSALGSWGGAPQPWEPNYMTATATRWAALDDRCHGTSAMHPADVCINPYGRHNHTEAQCSSYVAR
jgi:hypothetical protein